MKKIVTIFMTSLVVSIFSNCATAQDKGYYGLMDVTGGYIHKWVPGSAQAPYVGIAYAMDGVLDRTTDAYRRRYPAQVRIKFGIEF